MTAQQNKTPLPQLVDKPQRMTKAKRAVLATLQELGANFFEYGTPPYSVAQIAQHMKADLSNTAKTLQRLEQSGHVVRELRRVTAWNAIRQDHLERQSVCYWLAGTMEQDRAAAQAWNDGSRSESRDSQSLQRQPVRYLTLFNS